MNFEEQIGRIAAKLAQAGLTFSATAASTQGQALPHHESAQYGLKRVGRPTALGPTLNLSEVEAFEERHHVGLPEAYRQFLMRLGNGGAGPYTFLPLEKWLQHMDIPKDEVPPDYLSTPCLIEPRMYEREIWKSFYEEGPLFRTFVDTQGVEHEENYLGCGLVTLSSCGCNFFCTLVVSGPQAGRILYFGGRPYFSQEPDFLSWYERWLDERAAGYDLGYFGWGPRGDEGSLLEACEKLPETVFLRAITRCRQLSAEGLKVLWDSLEKPDAEVRELALFALRTLRVPTPPERLPVIVAIRRSDPNAICRMWATRILGGSRNPTGAGNLERWAESQLRNAGKWLQTVLQRLRR